MSSYITDRLDAAMHEIDSALSECPANTVADESLAGKLECIVDLMLSAKRDCETDAEQNRIPDDGRDPSQEHRRYRDWVLDQDEREAGKDA